MAHQRYHSNTCLSQQGPHMLSKVRAHRTQKQSLYLWEENCHPKIEYNHKDSPIGEHTPVPLLCSTHLYESLHQVPVHTISCSGYLSVLVPVSLLRRKKAHYLCLGHNPISLQTGTCVQLHMYTCTVSIHRNQRHYSHATMTTSLYTPLQETTEDNHGGMHNVEHKKGSQLEPYEKEHT